MDSVPPHRPEHLDLRGQGLTAVPEWVWSLRGLLKLHKLDLRWNKLSVIPSWVDNLERRGCAVLL